MPITSYDDYLAAAEAAKAQADFLRRIGAQGQPTGQMVSGRYVKPHWSQQLAPVLANVLGSYQTGLSSHYQGEAKRAMEAAAEEWSQSMPQAQTRELPGPVRPDEAPLTGTEEPPMQSRMAWAQRGLQNPLTKALAAQYGSELVKEPEREEARQARALEASKQRQQQYQIHAERLTEQARWWEAQAANQKLSIEVREEAQRRADETKFQLGQLQEQIARGHDAASRYSADQRLAAAKYTADSRVQANRNKMSDKSRRELDEVEGLDTGINFTLSKLDKVSESTAESYGRGVLSQFPLGGPTIAQWARDPAVKEARQLATNIAGEIQHGRYGTALSKYEKGAAGQYLPTDYDDPPAIAEKLRNIQKLVALNNKRLRAMAEGGLTTEEAQRAHLYEGPAGIEYSPGGEKAGEAEPEAIYTPGAARTLLKKGQVFKGTDGKYHKVR